MSSRRILGRAALVLCTAAIAAPAAQATFRDYAAGGTGGGACGGRCVLPAEHGRGGAVAQQDTRPVAQATFRNYGAGGTGGGAGAAPPRGPAEHGRGVAQQDTSPVVIDRRPIVLESGGFDWADAGIGAAGAAGLVLVGGGAVLLARRGRREQIATS